MPRIFLGFCNYTVLLQIPRKSCYIYLVILEKFTCLSANTAFCFAHPNISLKPNITVSDSLIFLIR